MIVLVAGASGTIGRPLSRELIAAGHRVLGITRTAANAAGLRASGVEPIVVDVLDREALLAAVDGVRADAVVHVLTALKKIPTKPSDMIQTNRLRTDGTANLIEATRVIGARRFVFESFIKGYGVEDFGERLLVESDAFGRPGRDAFAPLVTALGDGERQTLAAEGMTGVALRFGFLYGLGGASEPMLAMLRRRAFPIPFGGGATNSFVHAEDAASAIVRALSDEARGGAYNVADDRPMSWGEALGELARGFGLPQPLRVPGLLLRLVPYAHANLTMSSRLSNAKAKSVLGWQPRYRTLADGVVADVERFRSKAA